MKFKLIITISLIVNIAFAQRQLSNTETTPIFTEYAADGVLATNIISNTANVAFDIVTITIPSFGDWEITANANTKGVGVNTSTFWLTDANNIVIDGTGIRGEYPTANIAFPASINKTLTNIPAGTYKLRAMTNVTNALTIFASTATPLNTSGYTKITARKVGGFLPVAGQITNKINIAARAAQTTSLAVGNAILFNSPDVVGNISQTGGVFTLPANAIYDLTGGVGIANGTELIIQWRNMTTNTLIGTAADILNSLAGRNTLAQATVMVGSTPISVRLEILVNNGVTNLTAGTAIDFGRGNWANIQQVGSTGFSTLPITNGGTGSSTQNFVDLSSTAQGRLGSLGIGVLTPTSNLHIVGSLATSIRESTVTAITVAATDRTVIYTTTTGIAAFTLPDATTCSGREYRLVNYSATSGTVSSYTAFTGIAATTILAQSSIVVQSNGTTWRRVE